MGSENEKTCEAECCEDLSQILARNYDTNKRIQDKVSSYEASGKSVANITWCRNRKTSCK